MGFIFGGGTGETPQSIARKRAVAQAMQSRSLSRMPQNVGEGINSVGQALAAKIIQARADAGEENGREGAGAAFNAALGEGADINAAYQAIGNPYLNEGQRGVIQSLIAKNTPRYEKVGDNLIKIGPDGVTPVYEGFDKDKAMLGAIGPDGMAQAAQVQYGLAADANTQASTGSREKIAQLLEGGRNVRHSTASGGDMLAENGRMQRHSTASADATMADATKRYTHANASGGDKLSASVSTANNARTVGAAMRGQDIGAQTAQSRLQQNQSQFDASLADGQQARTMTPEMREYMMAQSDPGFANYQQAIKKAGASSVNVNSVEEKAFDKEMGKLTAKEYGDLRTVARNTYEMDGNLNMMEKAIDEGLYTGRGAGANQFANEVGAMLGIEGAAEKASRGELMKAVQNNLALYIRNPENGGGMPGATSERDVKFLLDSVPGLGQTAEGNRRVMGIFRQIGDRRRKIAGLADEWLMQPDENGRRRSLGPQFNKYVMDNLGTEREIIERAVGAEPAPAMGAPTQAAPVDYKSKYGLD